MRRARSPRLVSTLLGSAALIRAALLPASEASTLAGFDPASGLETITVYARRLLPVSRVAASVAAIDQTLITRSLAADIKELVRYEPGFTVRNDPFRFGLDTISVRGLGGNRVAIEIDGVPAAGGFAVGSFADTGRSFIDLAFVDRVEFLRGPASALYGSDAIAGIVAMSTVHPDAMLDEARRYAVRSEGGYATDDDGWHAALLAATDMRDAQLLAGYVRREGHELDTAAPVEPDPRRYVSDAVLGRLAIDGLPGGPLTLTMEGERITQDTAVLAFLGQPGRFANTTSLEGDDTARRRRLGLEQRLNGSSWFDSAEWRAYWQDTYTRQDTVEIRGAVPPLAPPVQLDRNFKFDERTLGVELTAVRALTHPAIAQDLVFGFDLAASRIDERRDGLQTNLLDGTTTSTILGEVFPVRDLPVTDVFEAGLFVQDELRFGQSDWSLVPALRADYYELKPKPDAIYREDNPSTSPVGLSEFSLTPKLGVICRFSENLNGYAQYARGFRSPPPEDVNIGLEIPMFNVRAIPNPALEPERSDGYEVGLRWQQASIGLAASIYYNEYSDFIESKVNLGTDPATGVTLFQSQNIAQAHIYGAEATLTLRAAEWAPRLEGFSARLVAAWSRGEDESRSVPLNSVDPPSAVAALRYDAPGGRWGGEVVLTGVVAKHDVDETRVDLYETDGYLTVDALANLALGAGLTLNAGIFNLTDADYIEWVDVRGRAANDPLVPWYTRPGRNASVTLRWTF
jgi:hemoglobin/transferrin/lactoferrin receptor protein